MARKIFIVLLAPVFAVLAAGACLLYVRRMPAPEQRNIVSPVWARPSLVESGGKLKVVVRAQAKPKIDKIILRNALYPDDLEYALRVDSVAFDSKSGMAEIAAVVPGVVPEFLYDIEVWYRNKGGASFDGSQAAVKVRRMRNGTFTFAVITGLLSSNSGDALKELNLLNPDFAVFTGGAARNAWTAGPDTRAFFHLATKKQTFPSFMVPNDYDSADLSAAGVPLRNGGAAWRSVFGSGHFSFDYEGYRFVGIDSGGCGSTVPLGRWSRPVEGCVGDEELKWLDAELAVARQQGLRPVLFMHHEPVAGSWTDSRGVSVTVFNEESRKKLLKIIRDRGVRAVFSGHVERDSSHWKNGTLFVSTGAGLELADTARPAMRLVTVVRGSLQQRFINYVRSPNSVPFGETSLVMRNANDGTQSANTFVFTNSLKRPLSNLLAVARMKPRSDKGDFTVEGADFSSQAAGRKSHYVFINCDLRAGEERIVKIK